jgi:hypothetical protein
LIAKRKDSGVARSQPAMADGVGRRRNVTLSSTASKRFAYVARNREAGVPGG